jgi:hypothetical protein
MFQSADRVIVKVRDAKIDTTTDSAPQDFITALKQSPVWKELVNKFPGINIEKLFKRVNRLQIESLKARAIQFDAEYEKHAPNFHAYFVIPCPSTIDADELANTLSSHDWGKIVEKAYVAGKPGPPPYVTNPGRNPQWKTQGTEFLRSAPLGIDAEWAWTKTGGDGGAEEGIDLQFVDVEDDWGLVPEELFYPPILVGGNKRSYQVAGDGYSTTDHGTGVLGIVVALDNGKMNLGITPHVLTTKICSQWDWNDQVGWIANQEEAILAAINSVKEGDVILLEMQLEKDGLVGLPVEYDEAIAQVIQLGTGAGRIIVEAAGNYGYHLDQLNKPWLLRNGAQYDSGAILVSAAESYMPHYPITVVGANKRLNNFGSRIDCYAWGDTIFTIKSASVSQYFGGTSGAAAIIAGAALSVQGMYKAMHSGAIVRPLQMRELLSDPSIGNTTSPNPATDEIGAMPNLQAIFGHL